MTLTPVAHLRQRIIARQAQPQPVLLPQLEHV
jgi:hypothetical protein